MASNNNNLNNLNNNNINSNNGSRSNSSSNNTTPINHSIGHINGNNTNTYPPMLQDQAYGGFTSASNPYPLVQVQHGAMAVKSENFGAQSLPQRHQSTTPRSDESTHNVAVTSNPAGMNGTAETKARLRKACDSCSIRKVKCDEEGPPCRPCAALDIPCTFERPSRRRGPPNRHAEAIKKRRFESDNSQNGSYSIPASPTNAAHALASFSQQQVLTAESICPLSLLYPLVDDYFTYIHPLIPVPHEPTFREALNRRDDLHDPTFLSLLAAMIGCLVVSFPRKPRLHLKEQRKENIFPNSMSLVDRCHKVAVEARGTAFLDKQLHVYDAAVSYLLGLTAAYGYKWRQSKLYFGECLIVLRSLGLHKAHPTNSPGSSPRSNPVDRKDGSVDYIVQEMGRRIFWVLFVGAKSLHQLGASYTELFIPPETPQDQYPPLPAEVDDIYIFQDRILPQPPNVIATTVGFNANVRVFCSYNALSTIDMAYGIDNCVDWDRQKNIVKHCLMKCKHCLDGVPRELMLRPRHPSGDFGSSLYDTNGDMTNGDFTQNGQMPLRAPYGTPQHRRNIQYEIQKANIYITQLGTRSHIVEKYWALCERRQRRSSPQHNTPRSAHMARQLSNGSNPGFRRNDPASPQIGNEALDMALRTTGAGRFEVDEDEMSQEREEIVRDLLIVLGTISQVNMEPNGGSLIHKIRQIASTLLDVPRTRKGALALSAEQCLSTFLEVLMKLERTGDSHQRNSDAGLGSPGGGSTDGSSHHGNEALAEDEEAELRHWADFRESQNRFAQAGGVLSEL